MIIDSHVHLEVYYGERTDPKQRVSNLKKSMKDTGVNKSIIIEDISIKNTALSSKEILDAIKDNKNLFLIGTIKITKHTKKDIDRLKYLLSNKLIIGVKLYPGYERFYPFEKKCDFVYDLCEKYDVPVVFHTGDTFLTTNPIKYAHPINIDELAVKRPNLKIVIAHLGNPWIEDTMVILGRHENVYADLSGLFYGSHNQPLVKYLKESINKLIAWCGGTDKLLFGTDWPYNEEEFQKNVTKGYIKLINSLDITKKDKDKIFYLNAQKVFKI